MFLLAKNQKYSGIIMKVHFTSIAFHGEDRQGKLKRCRDCAESFGWEFGVQLHNTAPAWIIGILSKEGVPLSVHGPLNQDRFWNLSRKEIGDTLAAMDRNFAEFEKLGIHEVVFHSSLMSDLTPEAFGHGKSYIECMQPFYRPEFARYPGKMFNRDFAGEPEFAERYELLRRNMELVRQRFPGFLIVQENDFPVFNEMNMFFRDMITLNSPLCLDTGHLWITTHQAGMDFQQEVKTAADSGLLRMCHLHSSSYTSTIPADEWSDGHKRLTLVNPEMDLPRAFRTMVAGWLDFFVLEISDADVEELQIMHQWLVRPDEA